MAELKALSENELQDVTGGLRDPEGETFNLTDLTKYTQYDMYFQDFFEHKGNQVSKELTGGNKIYLFETGNANYKVQVICNFSLSKNAGVSINIQKFILLDEGTNEVHYCIGDTIFAIYEYVKSR